MEEKYRVVFSGTLQSGMDQEEVINSFMKLTKRDREQAEQFLFSGAPKLINKNLNRETAEKYQQAFSKAGLEVELVEEPQTTAPLTMESMAPEPPQTPPMPPKAEVTDSQPAYQDTTSDNPYAAPKAGLKTEKTHASGVCQDLPEKVSASRGWHWIKDAFSMFIAKPWTWLAMFLIAVIILMGTSYGLPLIGVAISPIFAGLLGIIGSVLNMLLSMVIGGGFMLGAHAQAQGETLTVSYVFQGFRENRNQLLMAAVWYFLMFVVIGLVFGIIAGVGGLSMFGRGGVNPEALTQSLLNHGVAFFIFMLFCIVLAFAVMMAYWFALPLIAIGDHKALSAFSLSLRACLKNWLPFLVYGLVFTLIAVVTFMLISLFTGILIFAGGSERTGLAAVIPVLSMLILGLPSGIITVLSIYTAFRDIFCRAA